MSLEPGHALYTGRVWHRRTEPAHRVDQAVTMAWLDLDELEGLDSVSRLLSTTHRAPARFRREDQLGDPAQPLPDAVGDLVEAELGERPDGRTFLLANLRTWGWCFNPIAVYYCCDPTGRLVAQILDVSNTPWHERHAYVLDRREGRTEFHLDKALHVSPFLPMALTYDVTSPEPGAHLRLRIEVADSEGHAVLDAGLAARRAPLDGAGLRRLLLRTPTQAVSLGIYAHAVRLWRRGATFQPHPTASSSTTSTTRRDDASTR